MFPIIWPNFIAESRIVFELYYFQKLPSEAKYSEILTFTFFFDSWKICKLNTTCVSYLSGFYYMRTYTDICVCVSTLVHACVCVCACVLPHTHTLFLCVPLASTQTPLYFYVFRLIQRETGTFECWYGQCSVYLNIGGMWCVCWVEPDGRVIYDHVRRGGVSILNLWCAPCC